MKKIFLSFIVIISLFTIKVKALVEPTNEFYVNDYANVISSDVENYIISHSKNLEAKTKAQIVVVTVKNLEGMTLEEYATKLFREFGIGDEKENNGLLLLLALEERQFRVEVGYGLEGVLPDGLTGRYQDDVIIPYLKDNKWDEGIKNGYIAFYNKLCNYYGITSNEKIDNTINKEKIKESLIKAFPLIIIMSLISGMFLAFLFPLDFKRKKKKGKRKKQKMSIKKSLIDIIFSLLYLIFFVIPFFLLPIMVYWDLNYDILYRVSLIFIEFIITTLCYFLWLFLNKILPNSNSSDYFGSDSGGSFGASSGGGSSGGGGSSRGF